MATMRIGGINSGLDTEAIITTIIEAKMEPINALDDKVAEESEKLTAWSELDTKLTDLRSITQDLSSYLTWSQMSAESSNTSKLTATASRSARLDSYSIAVSALATPKTQTSADQSASVSDASTALGKAGSFDVNGETVTFDATSSLSDIADAINTASASMADTVTAYVIGTTIVVESDETGSGSPLTIDNITGDDLFTGGTTTAGTDLAATINGVDVTSSSNTNITTFIEDVTLNFYDTTTTNVTLDVDHDTETIKSLIQDMINKYNDAMELAQEQGEVSLTSSGAVSETGVLQGEFLLSNIQTQMRSILTSYESDPNVLDADYNSLYTVGIWFDDEDNQLSIVDEDALDDALENHFDEIEDLFRDSSAGVIYALDDYIYDQIDPAEGTLTMRRQIMEGNITDMNDEISQMEVDLAEYEADLWEHFADMENMVGEIQNEMNFMLSSLGMSSGG